MLYTLSNSANYFFLPNSLRIGLTPGPPFLSSTVCALPAHWANCYNVRAAAINQRQTVECDATSVHSANSRWERWVILCIPSIHHTLTSLVQYIWLGLKSAVDLNMLFPASVANFSFDLFSSIMLSIFLCVCNQNILNQTGICLFVFLDPFNSHSYRENFQPL